MESRKPFIIIFLFFILISLWLSSCDDMLWNGDIESFVDDGLTIIALREVDTVYVNSNRSSLFKLEMINPKGLPATYTVNAVDPALFTVIPVVDDSSAVSSNSLGITMTPTAAAEHSTLNFTLDITANSISRTYDTIYFSLTCDTPPNDVDLTVGTTTTGISVAAFTLPSTTTDDDLKHVEVTYNIEGNPSATTVLVDVNDASYESCIGTPDFTYTNGGANQRYFTPPGAVSAVKYDYSLVTADTAGLSSSAVPGSNSADYYSVTFSEAGGSWVSAPGTTYIQSGHTMNLPAASIVSYAGYAFEGWTSDGGTTVHSEGDAVTISGDTVFDAVWRGDLRVIYHGAGGDIEEYHANGDAINVSFDAAHTGTNGANTFAGWDTDISANTTAFYTPRRGSDVNTFSMPSSDVHLYPVWVNGMPIRTWEELEDLNQTVTDWGENIYLTTALIDLSAGYSHTPIGNSTDPFTGTLYGMNHSLENLNMTANSDEYGLFGRITGQIQDLTINNASLSSLGTTHAYLGIIAGQSNGGTIDQCIVNGVTSVYSGENFGGIVGYMLNGATVLDTTFTNSTLSNGHAPTGGIAGRMEATGSPCRVEFCTVANFAVTMDNMEDGIGGIAGAVTGTNAASNSINNCVVNDCNFTTKGLAGGISGSIDGGTISDCQISTLTLDNSASTGDRLGGLTGVASTCEISNTNMNDITITGNGFTTEVGGLVGFSTGTVSLNNCNLTRVYISNTSSLSAGLVGYAYRISQIQSCEVHDVSITNNSGQYVGGLVGRIHEGGDITSCTVEGVTIDSAGSYIGGLVGQSEKSSNVTGCIVRAPNITSVNTSRYIGGLIGRFYSETSGDIISCTVYLNSGDSINGGVETGGFIGAYTMQTWAASVTFRIENSCVYGDGTVNADNGPQGGFIGHITGLSGSGDPSYGVLAIDQCYARINLANTTATYKGGFIGDLDDSSPAVNITNCYYRGSIGKEYLGLDENLRCGFIGDNTPLYGALNITNSYAIAENLEPTPMALGLIYNDGSTNLTVSNSFYLSSGLINQSAGINLNGSLFQISTNFTGWNGAIWDWAPGSNDNYPSLQILSATY